MSEFKSQCTTIWAQMGDAPERWDTMLASVEDGALVNQQRVEYYAKVLSPKQRARRSRRDSMSLGLTEDAALEGFLEEIAKVPPPVARAGLLEGNWKGKEAEVEKMSDEQVLAEYKAR